MLGQFRNWVKSRFPSTTSSPTTPRGQRSAQEVREHRAHSVSALQSEVRHLQQEITDTSSMLEGDVSTEKRKAAEGKLSSLHSALEQKQGEVAKFQARI